MSLRVLGALFSAAVTTASADSGAEAADLTLFGGTVIASPDAEPILNAVVSVRSGKIVSVRPGSAPLADDAGRRIDCTGCTIVAGFWNSHVHFTEPKWDDAARRPAVELDAALQDMLTRYGFTTVYDLASSVTNTVALKRRLEAGELTGPKILTAGLPLYPKDGVPYYVTESLPPQIVAIMPNPATPEEAVGQVRANIEAGADALKLFLVTGIRRHGRIELVEMDPTIARAACEEAHRLGVPVFAHPSNIEGLKLATASGVDVLAHTLQDPENWTDDVLAELKEKHIALIPTLALFKPTRGFEGVMKEAKSFADNGGQLLFGTDVGFLSDYQIQVEELQLLARAGLTWRQILTSLTTAPAERFHLSGEVGRVAEGLQADLVIMEGDPTKNPAAFGSVRSTIRAGRVIFEAGVPR
jgi:imidazolonepropionase-like amidohydrolase